MLYRLLPCVLAVISLLGAGLDVNAAQMAGIPPEHHSWGAFKPGAWKQVRVVTETLDNKELVTSTSTTETTTSLIEISDDGVALGVTACMEVAGKRLDSEPQTVKQGLFGEAIGANLAFTEIGSGEVNIEGQKIPCKILQLESNGAGGKSTIKIYYAKDVPPYILKREVVVTDPTGEKTLSETVIDVVALKMPYKVLADIKDTSLLRAVQKHANGSVITYATTAMDVPGGIVTHTSKELDKSGRVVRRSVLELVDYGLEPERTGPFGGRRRTPRFQKPTPHFSP